MGDTVLIGLNTRKLLCLIGIFVVLFGLSFFVPEAEASPTIVKIMPLGDSITVGFPNLQGYRGSLYLDLNNSGFNVDFVGSQKNGTGFDNDNEGHLEYEANEIRDHVIEWLNGNPADIVLLHIGTNDIENGQNVPDVIAEVEATLDNINLWESAHGQVTVILARIILRSDSPSLNATTKSFDDALQTLAEARIASGDKIVVVDMENALNYSSDMSSDGIHPNLAGYAKMADVWYNALTKILGYKLTVTTNSGTTTPSVGEYWYAPGSTVTIAAYSPSAGAGERYSWLGWTGSGSGSYTGIDNNTSLVTMNGPVTETASWAHQYQVSFIQTGLDATTASGRILTVNDTSVAYSDLPYTVWVNNSDSLFYTYNATIASTTVGKQFIVGTVSPVSPMIGISSAQTVTGSYTTQYQLAMATNFGTTTPFSGNTWYNAGSTVTISAVTPNTGAGERYSWLGWTGSGSGSYTGIDNNTSLVTMNGPVTETASWNTEYKLTISTNLGTTQPSVGDHWYLPGASIVVESSSPSTETGVQYVCLGWSGTGSVPASGSAQSASFTLNAPSIITWTWKTQYYLTVSSTYGSPGGAGWYDVGSSAYATINPTTVTGNNGVQYIFTGWGGDASGSSSSSNAIVMDSSKTATANWSPSSTSTITPTPTPTHSATPLPTSSPSPSPSPTMSPSPTNTVGPSVSPSQHPSGINNYATYMYIGLALGVVLAITVVGVIVFRKTKK